MKRQCRAVISICIVMSFLTACATRPRQIKDTYVSPLQYQEHSCDQIRQEYVRVNRKIIEVTEKQDRTADKDAAGLIIGAFIFWPAVFLVLGGDKENELARLKGESQAMEIMSMQKKCDITQEVQEAREQRKKYDKKRKDFINQKGVGEGETLDEG